jgi:hypothetical protein
MSQVQPDVCYVDAQGNIICGTYTATPIDADTRSAVGSAFPTLTDVRANLIAALVKEVQNAQVNDNCIASRTDDIVQSVRILLQSQTPVMLLYRYVPLPGNIMAAYSVQQNKFEQARAALDDWSILKPGCS